MKAADNGHTDVIKLLLRAGASVEAKDNVSKRISICACVCVLYSCIMVLFYSDNVSVTILGSQHESCAITLMKIL